MLYYLDSCIWINFFNREGNFNQIAKKLIIKISSNNDKIIVSTIVLKELESILEERFNIVNKYFINCDYIILTKTVNEDYNVARKIEYKNNFNIGFYDCLHIAISKRLHSILITRDNKMIDIAKEYVTVNKPEELVS